MRSSTNEIIEIHPNKENTDGEFVEGLGLVCMEEGYTLEDVLQDTDQGMGGM